ncbi:hypothetical protein IAU59_001312 [Kwoniella sp. CBS 9459]
MSRSQSSSPYGSPTRYNDTVTISNNAEAGPSRSRTPLLGKPSSAPSSASENESRSISRTRTKHRAQGEVTESAPEDVQGSKQVSRSTRSGRTKRAAGSRNGAATLPKAAEAGTALESEARTTGQTRSSISAQAIIDSSKKGKTRANKRPVLDLPGANSSTTYRGRRTSRAAAAGEALNADTDTDGEQRDGSGSGSGFELREESSKAVSERIKRGWETRRANKRVRLERGEALIHRERDVVLENTPYTPASTPLPTSHMLLALHDHSARFYEHNHLIFQPIKKGRVNPWGSKKRLLIMQDALSSRTSSNSARTASAQHEGRHSKSLSLSVTPASQCRADRSERSYDDEDGIDRDVRGDGSSEGDELDGPREMRVKSEYVDRYGEIIMDKKQNRKRNNAANSHGIGKGKGKLRGRIARHARDDEDGDYENGESQDDDGDSVRPNHRDHHTLNGDEDGSSIGGANRDQEAHEDRARTRAKGKYKIRDMYRAIDGRGLMALGILVQEHVVNTLRSAGYRPRPRPRPRSRPVSGNPTQAVGHRGGDDSGTGSEQDNRAGGGGDARQRIASGAGTTAGSDSGSERSGDAFLVNQIRR